MVEAGERTIPGAPARHAAAGILGCLGGQRRVREARTNTIADVVQMIVEPLRPKLV
jgi:hypothetical protein